MIGPAKVPRASGTATGILILGLAAVSGCTGSGTGEAETAARTGLPEAGTGAALRSGSELPGVTTESPAIQQAPKGAAAEGHASDPVSIPAATVIPVVMEGTLAMGMRAEGDTFFARVVEEILAPDGMVLVPEGARMWGRVAESLEGRPPGRGPRISLTFESLEINGTTIPVDAVGEIEPVDALAGSEPTVAGGRAVIPEGTHLVVRLREPSVLAGH